MCKVNKKKLHTCFNVCVRDHCERMISNKKNKINLMNKFFSGHRYGNSFGNYLYIGDHPNYTGTVRGKDNFTHLFLVHCVMQKKNKSVCDKGKKWKCSLVIETE